MRTHMLPNAIAPSPNQGVTYLWLLARSGSDPTRSSLNTHLLNKNNNKKRIIENKNKNLNDKDCGEEGN